MLALILLAACLARPAVAGTRTPTLAVLNIAERTLDDAPALAVLFDAPLDARTRYDDYLSVTDPRGAAVGGGWVLGANERALYFTAIEPSHSYTVRVRRGLTAANGALLPEPVERTVQTRALVPTYGFASRGAVLPARLSDGLPVTVVNVAEIDVQFLRVKPEKLAPFINEYLRGGRLWRWDLQRLAPFTESVYLMRFTTGARRNARTVTHIPVEDIAELRQPGVYVAVMTRPGDFAYNAERVTHFFISDIGLHARVYSDGVDVYARSLASGRALPDVALELVDGAGKSIEKVRTDATGMAHLIGRPHGNQVLLARAGAHFALIAFREPALDLAEFDVAGRETTTPVAFVYAERDLYRPGETAHVSVLLRDADGRALPAQPLHVTLRRPDGKQGTHAVWPPRDGGYYQQNVAIPRDAPTGLWAVEVRADPAAQKPVGLLRLHVEEFLPERMKLTLASEQARLAHDDVFEIATTGAYLYGAPATGNRLTAVVNVARAKSPHPALADFVFGDVHDDAARRREELPETTLDADGRAHLSVRPLTARPNSPMRVQVTAALYETGGRPIVRSIERIAWPAPALIGIRPLWNGPHAPPNDTVRFELIRAGSDGALLAARDLDISVIREDRDYYWSYDEQQGWHYEHSETHYPVFHQTLSFDAAARGALAFPIAWGAYRIEVLDPETGLTARYRFRAGWSPNDPAHKNARPDRVVLALDKPVYRAGDNAVVTVTPPHAGEALVLVEGDRVLWRTRLTLPAAATRVTIPIAPEWARHDLYISAVVFRPADARERVTPNRATGVAHLPLDRTDRRLALTLEVQKQTRPEQPLSVKLRLPDLRGQDATVTVAAVDAGILAITDFATPDPHAHFFGKRRYATEAYDLYGKVIENLKGTRAAAKYGGDADAASLRKDKRARAEVKTVALFSGPIRVNAAGDAEVALPIPDFNGTLRVMAIAFTADRFGQADAEAIVAAPIVAEIAMPRFLAPGDRSHLMLDVRNLSGATQMLRLQLRADAPLALAPVDTRLVLEPAQMQSRRYDLSAEASFGAGTVHLTIEGEEIRMNRQWELSVRPAWPGERRVSQHTLAPGETLALGAALATDLMAPTVETQVVASSAPPLDIRSAVRHLLQYPYGCLEQTTSTAYPHLYIDATKAAELGLPPLTLAERAERIDKAIVRLAGMQLANGGFSLWGGGGPEEPWLTPYVTGFLLDAADQGFAVPSNVLARALDHLHRRLLAGTPTLGRAHFSDSPAHLGFAADAYAGYVLARVQRAPLGALRTLFDHRRASALSGLPLVHLGIALKLMGDGARGSAALREGLDKERDARAYFGDYGSAVRDTALMFALLERHDIALYGKDKLLFALGGYLHNRPHLSTQERFAIFLAGISALKGAGAPWRGTLAVGEHRKSVASSARWAGTFGLAQLRDTVALTNDNDATLYVGVETTGYPAAPPPPKLDEIHIERRLYTPDGDPIEERPLKVGELLLAHVRVRSERAIEDALVVDLLPAGLEIENVNISHGETLRNVRINALEPAAAMQSNLIKHQEYRDDRFAAAVRIPAYGVVHLFYLLRAVTPGTYIVPAPFVEDMYRPNLYGIGASPATLRVEDAHAVHGAS